MIKLRNLAFLISSIFLVATPAQANWQFTKWGMTSTEFRQASPVKLMSGNRCPVNNSNSSKAVYDVKYTSDWAVGNMSFIACYLFLNDRLHRVHLFSTSVDPEAVIKGLSQRYGSPEEDKTLKSIGIVDYEWDLPDEKIEFSIRSKFDYPYLISYESKAGSNENEVRDRL